LILVVDDSAPNLALLLDLLSGSGYRVSAAEDGESALEQAGYARPDLILLDVLMPGMDGFAVCARLKANPATQDIPVIFLTALADTVDKVKGFELGAVDYITKPFQIAEVSARVATHLSMQQLKQQLQENEQRLANVIDSTLDAIVVFDAEGRITRFNRAAERVFRLAASNAIGESCKRFLSLGLCKTLSDYLSDGGGTTPAPLWIGEGCCAVRADGETFPVEASLSCAETSGRKLYTFILRDIDERKKTEAEVLQLQGLNRYLEEELRNVGAGEEVIGALAGMRAVMQQVRQVACTDATVLITGETGTGKELIARAIHGLSPRKDKPLVKLNCAALPANLIESELFGHEKGAFTGALARKPGRFELADGGTLFLDEIGELPLDVQAKLLRVLQEGEFERLGGTRTLHVDVRIVAATNRELAQEVSAGRLRADLYYRLHVFPIAVPPLRERKEDIASLAAHFVRRYATKYGKRIGALSQAQLATLRNYRWPGNVRELEHVIERAVILTQNSRLTLGDWFGDANPAASEPLTLDDAQRAHILKILEQTGGRVSGKSGAAELLGLKPTTLESRMKKLAISRNRDSSPQANGRKTPLDGVSRHWSSSCA
jgi:PAS domain S-box-containing protein